jgi:LacI family transcriptional regulator/LacI family purine nucleotide synthesis repressor
MGSLVRMKDIAQKVGVSTVSVSKALSGQRGVSDSVRARIIECAEQMGYVYPEDRKKKKDFGYNIGILIANRYFDRYNSFYGNLQQLVNAEASKMSCSTMLEVVPKEDEERHVVPHILAHDTVDGLIVLGYMDEAYLEHIRSATKLPQIYLDFQADKGRCDCVISDSFYGAYQLTSYLIEHGHREIAYVGTLRATGSIMDRYLGYLKAMMEHGLEVKKGWVIEDRDIETGKMDVDRFFSLPEKLPTAFVCNCDLAAGYLSRKLEEMGVRCPQDVSIVGYDNFSYSAISERMFTTYEVDTREMARKAVHNMIHKLNGEYYRKGVTIVTGRIVERDSVRDFVNSNN